tara:strand:- start:9583 stop:10572 length:990 start_codon:yes stop_codon:yes gene_type:complete
MKDLIRRHLFEVGHYGNVITKDLPKELDNSLYILAHFLGGFDFMDVIKFSKESSQEDVEFLGELVSQFPSKQYQIMRNVGGFTELRNSKQYQEILSFLLDGFSVDKTQLSEEDDMLTTPVPGSKPNLSVSSGNFDKDVETAINSQWFKKYVDDNQKSAIFKMWDDEGDAWWDALDLASVTSDKPRDFSYNTFGNVINIIYPLLRLSWIGGIRNTLAGKLSSKLQTLHYGDVTNLEYYIVPTGFDYSFEDSEGFGGNGHSCWSFDIFIKGDGRFNDITVLDLLPERKYPQKVYHEFDDNQWDLIESVWEQNSGDYQIVFDQFCKVGLFVF